MRLKITHRTEYNYEQPVPYTLQRVRLMPASGSTQTVQSWDLDVEGAREEVRFVDHLGNDTRLYSITDGPTQMAIVARGEVDTRDTAGVYGRHLGFAPLWLFQRETPLTAAGERVHALAEELGEGGSEIDRLHRLMAAVAGKVMYQAGATDTATMAEQVMASGKGVCQDHAHVFIATARRLGFPARYVSGYLMLATTEQTASHAWAEAHVPSLGWVAFDPSNGISPDERYVRLAVGRDYREAMPVTGIRLGQAAERLEVRITVEQ
ncbi:MAG: transglutaminase family protein [Rhizobiaceae bacterium]|nr:transglutaminase family protein [Rhizobiaceae bacterium]